MKIIKTSTLLALFGLLLCGLLFAANEHEGNSYGTVGGYDRDNSCVSWYVNGTYELIPGKDDTYDLGTSSYEIKDAYIDGILYADTISGVATLSATTGTFTGTVTGEQVTSTDDMAIQGSGGILDFTGTTSNTISCDATLSVMVSADDDDYLAISASSGIITIDVTASDDGDLIINAGGGDISFGNENIDLGSATVDCGELTMIKGAQTGDPQLQITVSGDANGDVGIDADTGDITITAGGGDIVYSSGTVTWQKGSDVAADTTITVGTGNFFDITGTANCSSIAAEAAGTIIVLQFDSTVTITDGSNLKLTGNMTTGATDTLILISDGTNWYELGRNDN